MAASTSDESRSDFDLRLAKAKVAGSNPVVRSNFEAGIHRGFRIGSGLAVSRVRRR